MKTAIVIPARYGSTRLPAKALLSETGKPLIQHVYEQASQATLAERIIIATDDDRIIDAVQKFGGETMMTSVDHPNGTSRINEVVQARLQDFDMIVNVQGDEPELEPETIDHLIRIFGDSDAFAGTLAAPFNEENDPSSPDVVKAVLGQQSTTPDGYDYYDALYFSRSLIPYPRDDNGEVKNRRDYYLHIGMYAYTPASLKDYVDMPLGRLEDIEKLEQLRILENKQKITVGLIDKAAKGIDTRKNYEDFIQRWQQQQNSR